MNKSSKQYINRLLLAALLMILNTFGAVSLFGKNVNVEAIGFGVDSISALSDAKRNATEMAYKTLVSSKTKIQNDSITEDAVSLHSYGMIKKYSILECNNDNKGYTIKIKAKVLFSKYLGGQDRVKSKVNVRKAIK